MDLMQQITNRAYERLGNVQGRTAAANLGQVEEARHNYQRALDLYARLPVNAESPPELRRRLANVLLAAGRLEYDNYREAAAEPITRRMLDLIGDRAPDAATRLLRALGERSLGDILLKQGRAAEALTLMESSTQSLLDLQSSAYSNPDL